MKCTCGHEEKEHFAFGCSKCFCSEFSTTVISPLSTIAIGIVIKNPDDKGKNKKDKDDKSD